MAFSIPKEVYSGKVNKVTIGKGDKAVSFGGSCAYPFHSFDGEIAAQFPVAFEVLDEISGEMPETLKKEIGDALNKPIDWAVKAQNEFGAEAICIRLLSTHPDGTNRSPEDAGKLVKSILEAIEVPLLIFGANHLEKDAEVIKHVAEVASGYNCLIGKAQEKNYKTIAAAAMAYGHHMVALSNLDINLAKQLNILLSQVGVPSEKVVMDTMGAALGYGLEYSYSVMERVRSAALKQNDTTVQMPIIADIGLEVWKAKESKTPESEQPTWGNTEKRGINWEIMTAMSMLMGGADMLVMRHPTAIAEVRKRIEDLRNYNG